MDTFTLAYIEAALWSSMDVRDVCRQLEARSGGRPDALHFKHLYRDGGAPVFGRLFPMVGFSISISSELNDI